MNAIRAKLLAGSVALIATLSLAAERVPGTKVTLDPPKGFAKSTQFPGYMMAETGASIMVSQIPGPIAEVAKGFTKEGLAKNGMNLLATKTVTTKTGKTTLYHVAQSARGTDYLKWMIAFGNEKETVLVVATFPRKVADEWSEKLRKSVVGARWDTSAAVGAFEGLTFRVSAQGNLKIAKTMGNNVILTPGGVFPQKNPDDPLALMGSSITEDWEVPGDLEAFTRRRLLQAPIFKDVKISSTTRIAAGGLKGYLCRAELTHKDGGARLAVQHALLFSKDGYYIFQAMCPVGEKAVYDPLFSGVLKSFKVVEAEGSPAR
jgi:hypothetical protein